MYTFKAQAKSNAKRFLVATAKVANFEDYLCQHEGQWGTWMKDGQPVPSNAVRPVEDAVADTKAEEVVEETSTPSASAFAAFAAAQLGGDTNAVSQAAAAVAASAAPAPQEQDPAPAPKSRAGVTPTTGLKIQKDREERNGVKRQSDGSVGARLWALFDSVGKDCTLMQATAMAQAHGLSTTSAAIALYRWRRFNGYGQEAK